MRLAFVVPAIIAHLYLLAMLIAWLNHWYTGNIVPTRVTEFGMYLGAFVCVLASAVVIFGIVRNQWRVTFISALATTLGFAFITLCQML